VVGRHGDSDWIPDIFHWSSLPLRPVPDSGKTEWDGTVLQIGSRTPFPPQFPLTKIARSKTLFW
jgi:hypothetical protein